MSLAPTDLVQPSIPARPRTAADWLASIGDVPLDRVLFDPPPGTATEADALRLDGDAATRCEVVNGTLVVKTTGWEEGIIEINIARIVGGFIFERKLGVGGGPSTMMKIVRSQVRMPDFSFFSHATLAMRDKTKRVPILRPDLAVEVISEGNTPAEMALKLAEYFEAGTRVVWYVYPHTKTVDVHTSPTNVARLTEADTIAGGDVLPGFECRVAEFFAIE